MKDTFLSSLMDYLVRQEAAHRDCARALAADSRGDDADFEKIRANVYGIYKAILETAVKLHGESEHAAKFFERKLRELPSHWRLALSNAREHGDSAAAHVEKLKLETADEIVKAFAERSVATV